MEANHRRQLLPHTVYSDGNSLVEGVTISADECWDLSELVELQVLCRESLDWLRLDNLEFDIVRLGHCKDSRRAGVALKNTRDVSPESKTCRASLLKAGEIDLPGRCTAFRKAP